MKKILLAILIFLFLSVTAQAKDKENIVYLKYNEISKEIDCINYNINDKSKKTLFSFPNSINNHEITHIEYSINLKGNIILYLSNNYGYENDYILYWDNKNTVHNKFPLLPEYTYMHKGGGKVIYNLGTFHQGIVLLENNQILWNRYFPYNSSGEENGSLDYKHQILTQNSDSKVPNVIFEEIIPTPNKMVGISVYYKKILNYNTNQNTVYLYDLETSQFNDIYKNVYKYNITKNKIEQIADMNGQVLDVSNDGNYIAYNNQDTSCCEEINSTNNQLFILNLATKEIIKIYDEYEINHNKGDGSKNFLPVIAKFSNNSTVLVYSLREITNYDPMKSPDDISLQNKTFVFNIATNTNKVIDNFLIRDYLNINTIIGEDKVWVAKEITGVRNKIEIKIYNMEKNQSIILDNDTLGFVGAY